MLHGCPRVVSYRTQLTPAASCTLAASSAFAGSTAVGHQPTAVPLTSAMPIGLASHLSDPPSR